MTVGHPHTVGRIIAQSSPKPRWMTQGGKLLAFGLAAVACQVCLSVRYGYLRGRSSSTSTLGCVQQAAGLLSLRAVAR